ncbi:MAG: substrate-binding domain-containing protein [Verrucomicrobia bacterium]|nr:substrate-binding domain-containing protein [Verrucomicrobiota bacterium]
MNQKTHKIIGGARSFGLGHADDLQSLGMHLDAEPHRVRLPAAMRVYHELHAQICNSRLRHGARLPPEPILATQFHVSRPTLRISLARLEREGFISRRPGDGTRVCFKSSRGSDSKTRKTVLYVTRISPDMVHANWHLPLGALSGVQRAANDFGLARCWTSDRMIDHMGILDELESQKNFLGTICHESSLTADNPLLIRLQKSSAPWVLLQGTMADEKYARYTVRADITKAFYLLTQHLIQLGHRRILFVGRQDHVDRVRGYRRAIVEARLRAELLKLTRQEAVSLAAMETAALTYWKTRPLPTAIVASSDVCAFGVLQSLKKLRIRVPADVSLVGQGDRPDSAYVRPPLTTTNSRLADSGYEAVRLLLGLRRKRKKPQTRHIILEPQLILRESTASPPRLPLRSCL